MMVHAKADKGAFMKFFGVIKEKLGSLENTVLEFTGLWSETILIGYDLI